MVQYMEPRYLKRLKILCQSGNQKPKFEDQTITKQMTEKQTIVDKIHYGWATRTSIKHGDEFACSGRVCDPVPLLAPVGFHLTTLCSSWVSFVCPVHSCVRILYSCVRFWILLYSYWVHCVRFENSVFVLRTLCSSWELCVRLM